MDNIFTACEIVVDYRQNKEKGLLLKLDIEKAYDYADWDLTILWHEKILAWSGESGYMDALLRHISQYC